nr:redoxin domain-containing protein [Pseudopedobacter sp.]
MLILILLCLDYGITKANQKSYFEKPISEKQFTDSIILIKDYQKINNLNELLEKFKGRPVMIDLWATWCPPCIKAFNEKSYAHLLPFIDKNNIVLIFISFDSNETSTDWKNFIQNLDFKSYHLRCNQNLKDNLTEIIWGGKNVYSIPNAMLFDSNHKIMAKTLPSVEDIIKLEDTITELLK